MSNNSPDNNAEKNKSFFKRFSKKQFFITCALVFLLFIGIPIIINILYLIGGPIKTAWYGAEFLGFYGAALSAIGAAFLGGISIWQNAMLRRQNDKLREENKESQNMIEKLYKEANELSIINKIIDNESQRIDCLAKECLSFYSNCDSVTVIEHFRYLSNIHQIQTDHSLLSEKARVFYSQISSFIKDDDQYSKDLDEASKELMDAYIKVLDCFVERRSYTKEQMLLESVRIKFQAAYSDYIKEYQQKLDLILFNSYSLEMVRSFYGKSRSNYLYYLAGEAVKDQLRQMEEQNGQDEDAE